jgi:glycosyltransferase involved in cell wall biosynthesis
MHDHEVVLDLSRLLSRVLHPTPTGVDRVEMAYARGLMEALPDRLSFSAVQPSGLYGRLDTRAVRRFLDETEERWDQSTGTGNWARWHHATGALLTLRPRGVPPLAKGRRRVYLQASPHHLDQRARVAAILAREQAGFVCLVHDLIPIEYPEYARADGAERHRARISTVVDLCDSIITNSEATRRSLQVYLERAGRNPLVRVVHLGTAPLADLHDPAPPPGDPYFVCIGTIEPRKNHLLLLNVWRRMSEELGSTRTPRLFLVGRRGWENEQVIDMLERCPSLHDRVTELSSMSDRAVARLLRGATALLLPSFAEGFGMPVTEALSAGVPVICSDLPVLREAADGIADYIDPLDGPAWMARILDYAAKGSLRRTAQLERLAGWVAPSWRAHIDSVLELLDETVA